MLDDALLARICVVLVETSHPGNVGAVARAMKTMGLNDLRLVRPRFVDVVQHEEAVAFASGAQDVLDGAKIFDDLPQALHDVGLAFALSARQRTLAPVALQTPTQAAALALRQLNELGLARVAFVFGSERVGLSNADVLRCQCQVTIECNPDYSSLNLAQAVQIVCYALRCAALAGEGQPVIKHNALNAGVLDVGTMGGLEGQLTGVSVQAVDGLHAHFLEAMHAVGFFSAKKSDKLTLRLSRLLAKVPFEKEEIDLLRGFLREVVNAGKKQ